MGKRKAKIGRVSDVDIRLLRIFQTVVESGGLSAAEVELGIGRSTISTHLADIETRLGARLCDRGRSGFALTSDGQKVYRASQGLMKSLEHFQHEVSSLHGTAAGELKIGQVDNLIWDRDFDLVGAFRAFSKVGSDVDMNIYVLSPDEIEKRILDGALHLGLAPIVHQVTGVSSEVLFAETSLLYCGAGHPLFDLADAAIDDGMISSCSYVRKGYSVGAEFSETNERLQHHVNAYHVETIAALILTGAYIGFLPEYYAQNWLTSGQMRCLRPDHYRAVFELGAIWRKNRSLTHAEQIFLDCLLDARASAAARAG